MSPERRFVRPYLIKSHLLLELDIYRRLSPSTKHHLWTCWTDSSQIRETFSGKSTKMDPPESTQLYKPSASLLIARYLRGCLFWGDPHFFFEFPLGFPFKNHRQWVASTKGQLSWLPLVLRAQDGLLQLQIPLDELVGLRPQFMDPVSGS